MIEEFLSAITEMMGTMNCQRINGYNSIFEFVLRQGRPMPEIAPRPKGMRKGRDKQCFANASRWALRVDRDYTYCEGYALGIVPVHHAWLLNRDGQVIETTWKVPSTGYYGIPVNVDYLSASLLNNRTYGLIDRPEFGWPMLHAKPSEFLYVP